MAQAEAPGVYYIGSPVSVAERMVHLHDYMRHGLQMDIGGLWQEHLLESITLLTREVKPCVARLLEQE